MCLEHVRFPSSKKYVKDLIGLTSLNILNQHYCNRHIVKLTNLRELSTSGAPLITETTLLTFPNLTSLSIHRKFNLNRMTCLRNLRILERDNPISIDVISFLPSLVSLEVYQLDYHQLSQLHNLTSLKVTNLRSYKNLTNLVLPNLRILHVYKWSFNCAILKNFYSD